MENKMPTVEAEGPRSSDLDVPLFKTEDFTKMAIIYLRHLTKFQWKLLANEFIDEGTIKTLSSMLFDLVNAVTAVIYQHVAPQVKDRLCNLPVPDPSNTVRIVTEHNIHASIGDSLHFCFGKTLGVKQWKTQYSEQLTELFVAEVTKGVNRKLSNITSCACHLPQLPPFKKSDTKDMNYFVSRIFSRLIREDIEAPEDDVKFIFPLSNRDAFTLPGDQECSDNVIPEGLKSLLRQLGFVLSDGGDVESPGYVKCPHKGLCPQELGPEEATEINSTLDQEEFVPSGGGDVESPVDMERLEELLSSFDFGTEEATEFNPILDQEGFTLSGGGDVESPEDPEYPDKILCPHELGPEEATEFNPILDQEGFALSGGGDVESPEDPEYPDEILCPHELGPEEATEFDSTLNQEGFALSGGGDVESPEDPEYPDEILCPHEICTEEAIGITELDQQRSILSGEGDVRAQGDRDSSEGCCPDKETDTEVLSSPKDIEVFEPEQQGSVCSDDPSQSPSASSTKGSLQQEKIFLTTFLGNLLSHIANATKTSTFDVDLNGMVEQLNNRIVGQITLPQTVENIHIPIYKQLCRIFGSAKKLQAAVVTREAVFIDTVARTLEVELLKSPRKSISFATKVKRFFRGKKAKVAPSCETDTTESHSAVINLENGSTPPPQKKQKQPAIIRIFKILCKPFSCCISSGTED